MGGFLDKSICGDSQTTHTHMWTGMLYVFYLQTCAIKDYRHTFLARISSLAGGTSKTLVVSIPFVSQPSCWNRNQRRSTSTKFTGARNKSNPELVNWLYILYICVCVCVCCMCVCVCVCVCVCRCVCVVCVYMCVCDCYQNSNFCNNLTAYRIIK